MTTDITTRRFQTAKGQSVAADVAGPEHGKPIVLMHGGGQTRHSWKKALQLFAEAGYRTYSLDARGHGDSDWDSDGDYMLDAMSSDLRAVAARDRRPACADRRVDGRHDLDPRACRSRPPYRARPRSR